MLDELYMQDLANAMRMPDEVVPTGKVTVSGPQVETTPKQPEMGTITGIPQTAFEKALETSGVKLSELGDMIDQSAPGTLNTLLGREVPIIGNLKLRDFLPFVGSKDDGKLTGTPAALIAAGTGQPLRGQPVVGSSIGPDGQRYYGTSGSPSMLSEDVGTAMVDVATLGLGKPLVAGAKKAVKATKNMPVGMSTKAVGQGVDELGFYSAAKQAVDAIQQPKGTGQQFLKQIEKTPGVKPDEIKWTGLDEFLQSKKSVTKAEVQEYLDKNKVEIKEVRLGEQEAFDPARLKQLETEYSSLKQHPIDDPSFGEEKYDELIKLMNIRDRSTTDSLYASAESATRAAQRAQAKGMKDTAEKYFKEAELYNTRAEKLDLNDLGMDNPTKFSKYTLPGGENYREILLTLPTKMLDRNSPEMVKAATEAYGEKSLSRLSDAQWQLISNKLQSTPEFKSQHFDQPNILAHLRVNDRVIDGKKTLFVEEVQSDWHQAGRKKGYAQAETKRLKGRVEAEPTSEFGFAPEYKVVWEDGTFSGGYSKEGAEAKALEGKSNAKSGVPDAPFKTTWSDLSMKRVIQLASEGGYDRIAFTTGKTQAERFDLSKQVKDISYMRNEDGTYGVTAFSLEDIPLIEKASIKESDLADYVGKDVAEKIISGKGKIIDKTDPMKVRSLTGVDLSVGGEGMKGFYDDILPKFLDKYAKKWDAKTGVTDLVIEKAGSKYPANIRTLEGGSVKRASDKTVPVNYIDVTPKMRESVVTKGQPMFAIGAGGAGAAATQEENK
jgi:hypothetical protein